MHGWRDLSTLVLLSALLIFPLKWFGPAIGFPVFAQEAVTYSVNASGGWRVHVEASAALLGAVILGSLAMIAGKRISAMGRDKPD